MLLSSAWRVRESPEKSGKVQESPEDQDDERGRDNPKSLLILQKFLSHLLTLHKLIY